MLGLTYVKEIQKHLLLLINWIIESDVNFQVSHVRFDLFCLTNSELFTLIISNLLQINDLYSKSKPK